MSVHWLVYVDEQKCRYATWAIHDQADDKKCEEMYQLIHKWPSANVKKCEYGVKTLNDFLTEVLEAERKKAEEKLGLI